MRQYVNGRKVDAPIEPNGSLDTDTLRSMCNIPPDRALMLKRSDGSNEVINPGEKIRIQPDQLFEDMIVHRRG